MSKKNLVVFSLAFVLLIAVVFLNRRTFRDMKTYAEQVDHTRDIISSFEKFSNHFKSAQIYTLNDSNTAENFYALYKKDADSVPAELKRLGQLIKDNPEQEQLIDSITSKVQRHLDVLKQKNIAEIIQTGETWRLNDLFAIHEMINRGIAIEAALLAKRK